MKKALLFGGVGVVSLGFASYLLPASFFNVSYGPAVEEEKKETYVLSEIEENKEKEIQTPKATHIKTPEELKALYMTSWVAGTPSLRNKVVAMIEETGANSIVIDIKDDTGKISFLVQDPELKAIGSDENRIPDIKEFIEELHSKNIYVIGRISVFQDPYLIKKWPELAVKRKSDTSVLWRDRKGIGWFDAGSQKVWDYVISIGEEAYSVGFDELNFDYIRFPSDGDMKDIYYPLSNGKEKPLVLWNFFSYLNEAFSDSEVVLSADLFGMTATNTDDLNIGQILEFAMPHFDYICPMVYPSHYPKGFRGYSNVNEHSYDIVFHSMKEAVRRAVSTESKVNIPGSTPIIKINEETGVETIVGYQKESYPASKIRPWLQDFNYPVTYTANMVKDQIRATNDAGLDSWMMWDPSNTYTKEALNSI